MTDCEHEPGDEKKIDYRAVYGRGFHDGVKSATRNFQTMNVTRLRQLEAGLHGQMRKVYEVLAVERGMTIADVMSRLGQRGRPERATVERSLHECVERGLATESGGQFRRMAITEPDAKPALTVVPPSAPPSEASSAPDADQATPAPRAPLDVLADIEARLALMLDELSAIREAVSTAAVEIETRLQATTNDQAKLAALRSLLRDIGE